MGWMRTLGILAALLPWPPPGSAQQPAEAESARHDGMALDDAIARLLECNSDLRLRSQEIPKARADELTASLRNAPAIFLSGDQLPYGRYSEQRPGAASYGVSLAQNIDFSGKRGTHQRQARAATQQTEARYQDAVRREIDRLYDLYVDVLEGEAEVEAVRDHIGCMTGLAAVAREPGGREKVPEAEATRLRLRLFNARLDQEKAEEHLRQARSHLALLLDVPADRADGLVIRGSLHDQAPPPPCPEDLFRLARESRPDLAAARLGVVHARATVQAARAERFDDMVVFYEPYQADDNSPQGKRSSSGWGGGAGTALPLLDRNQGVIAHARTRVEQVQLVQEGLERLVANQVQHARTEYEASGDDVRRHEQVGLPAARRLRDDRLRRFAAGAEDLSSTLDAQEIYARAVESYRAALGRHRRSMLKLNTAVGQRILP